MWQRAVTALTMLLPASLPSPRPLQTQAVPGRRAGAAVVLSSAGPSCSPSLAQLLPSGTEKCRRELEPRYCLKTLALIKDSAHGKFELLLINDHCAKRRSILTLDSLWI